VEAGCRLAEREVGIVEFIVGLAVPIAAGTYIGKPDNLGTHNANPYSAREANIAYRYAVITRCL
jgi:hypothetical protein